MSQPIPEIFGQKYRIIEQIGQGGFATVYRAVDTTLERDVAVKALDPLLLRDPTFLERFRREAKIIAKLNHPNIIAVYEIGEDQGRHFIVMPYISGASLHHRITQQGAMDPAWVARLAGQVGAALDYAHQQELIHRDVKPANVLLDTQGNALLTDFGIAKAVTESTVLTRTGTHFGSPPYMAPEQWTTGQVDHRADIYSLGVMLYELLAGQTPFTGGTSRVMFGHVHEPPPSPRALNPSLPLGVEKVLLKALSKDPVQRYQTAGQLATDLQTAASGRSVKVGIPIKKSPQVKKIPWPIYAVAGVVVILMIIAVGRIFNQKNQSAILSPTAITNITPTQIKLLSNTAAAVIAENESAETTPATDHKVEATTRAKVTSTAQAYVVATHRTRIEATTRAGATSTARTARGRATFTAIAGATAKAKVQAQAAPTSTPAPTATPISNPSGLLPAPLISGPDNAETFEDPYRATQITLSWEPVKPTLAADEYYLITIPYKHQGQIWIDYGWTQQSNWTVSDHQYLLDMSDDGFFTWSVTLIRREEADANGVPQGPALSHPSQEQTFIWRAPIPGVFESPIR